MANLQLKTKKSKTALLNIPNSDLLLKAVYFDYFAPLDCHLFLVKSGNQWKLIEFSTGITFLGLTSKKTASNEYVTFSDNIPDDKMNCAKRALKTSDV